MRPNALPPTDQVHIGRQPIFDQRGRVAGYELLFRADAGAAGASSRGAYATSQVIVNAFTEFGLRNLVGDGLGFINLTREFVTGDLPLPFPPDSVVLEILDSVPVDDQVVSGILKLVDAGYRVALDDFVLGQGHEQLLTVASFVKINFMARHPAALDESVARCRRYPRLRLIAERVEEQQQIRRARRLRFDLLQGYGLQQPQTMSVPGPVLSTEHLLRLFVIAYSAEADPEALIATLRQDPAMNRKLERLRMAAGESGSCADCGNREPAACLDLLRRWLTLMLICSAGNAADEHLKPLLTRARMCRTVGERLNVAGEACFTAGLLSGIAEFADAPAKQLVEQLPMCPEVRQAVFEGGGKLGRVLAAVRAYERRDLADLTQGNWEQEQLAQASLGFATALGEPVGSGNRS
jgi:c-di-GMP-related signal transduction protein